MADEQLEQLPASLKPKLDKETLDIKAIGQDEATDINVNELPEIAEEFRLIGIDQGSIKALAKLGIIIEGVGSVQIANGAVYLTLEACIHVAKQIRSGATDPEKAAMLADPLAKMSREITKLSNSLKTKIPTSAKAAPGPNRTASFPSDAPININQAVVNVNPKS